MADIEKLEPITMMKKLFNHAAIFGLLTVAFLFFLSACKKESLNEANLTGKWMTKYPNSQTTPLYEFKSNHTFQYSMIATDSITKKNIGIISKSEGNYQVKNGQLNLFNIVYYENKSHQFGPVTDLIIANSAKTESSKIVLDDKKNTLSIYFVCPPNADCVPSPIVYYKQ